MENRGLSFDLHRQHRTHKINDDPENRRNNVRFDLMAKKDTDIPLSQIMSIGAKIISFKKEP